MSRDMTRLSARLRSWWRTLRRPDRVSAEMEDEMRLHLDLHAERLVRERGLAAHEARRQAAIAFGGVAKYQEAGRDVRGLAWVSGLSIDLKLAWRMLVKSPGLTVVGVLGLALGTAIGIGSFVVLTSYFYPTLPLEEGDRIVALANRDIDAGRAAPRSLRHFLSWRDEMQSVRPVAAASLGRRALNTSDAPPLGVMAAEMTAAGFEVARVPPLLGRSIIPDDEHETATRVAVLGYDLWQAHFEGDPAVIGRSVLVDGTEHVVVGVMPPGFAFPMNQELWTALRPNTLLHACDVAGNVARDDVRNATRNAGGDIAGTGGRAVAGTAAGTAARTAARAAGPELFVFGRLAPGATREQAQAELVTLSARVAATSPDTDTRLQSQVLPYTYPLDNIASQTLWDAARLQLMVLLLLIAIAVNTAVLVYARTAMRQGEIAIRTALGASRRRIITQLFVEALVLSTLGAALGLAIAHGALLQGKALLERVDGMGFWVDYGVQPRSFAFAVVLAVVCAAIVGVLPGLKSTGRRMHADLRRIGSGTSVRLGRAWTALIVAQVAIAVTVLPTAMNLGFREVRIAAVRPTFAEHEFLAASVGLAMPIQPGIDADDFRRESAARFATRLAELERRLEAEPAVAGVTLQGRIAGRGSLVEVEGVPGRVEGNGHWVHATGVATDYFDVIGAHMLGGRSFRAADARAAGGGVVVSESFARWALAGGAETGRRIRFLTVSQTGRALEPVEPGPWLDVVGVVRDLHASVFDAGWAPSVVYYALPPGELQAAQLLVRVRGDDVAGFAPRLREITASVDADLRLVSVAKLADVRDTRYLAVIAVAIQFVLGTALLLSAAGIHALMSITVTRRRREIGIRTALGARPGRLLASIFSRAGWQLALGGLVGCLLGAVLLFVTAGLTAGAAAVFLGGVIVLMLMVGLLATLGPARRGLRIQPMEAVRED
jgi:putative ABC transport system permease protein